MAVDFEKIKDIIEDKLGCDRSAIKEDTSFADLGADSLDSVELIMGFEEEFDIEIPDSDAQNIKSVSDAIKYIEKAK